VVRYLKFHRGEGQWIHPRALQAQDIAAFLSDLASRQKVAAATQAQALNALVFLYREVIHVLVEESQSASTRKTVSCRAANHEIARQQLHYLCEQAELRVSSTVDCRTDICMSAVSYVEVLGYHLLTLLETPLLEKFFANTPVLSLSAAVPDQAVKLQGLRRTKLGDALIAATALVHRCELVTSENSPVARVWRLAHHADEQHEITAT